MKIDGEPIDQIVAYRRQFIGASNDPALMREIAFALLEGPAGPVELDVRRNGEKIVIAARRVEYPHVDHLSMRRHDRDGEAFQLLRDDVAYVKASGLEEKDVPRLIQQALEATGLIVDLRGYPKSFLIYALGQHLVSEPTEFARISMPTLQRPGEFQWSDPLELTPKAPYYDKPIAILVDEMTQSQAEYTAMAYRANPNAIVIGSQTAGADGNVSRISLPGGSRTAISGIGIFYPDKTPTQRIGIVPDIVVKPTICGIRDGRDEVLDTAIEHILRYK